MKKFMILFISAIIWALSGSAVFAHCQVPCGIYDDHARVVSMLEDTATVEKAMGEMKILADKKDLQSQNQMVRWVVNKEKHADNIISTISDYFLTQRVKEEQKDYEKRLKDHHKVIVSAMKVKQNTNKKYADELRRSIEALDVYYPEHKH